MSDISAILMALGAGVPLYAIAKLLNYAELVLKKDNSRQILQKIIVFTSVALYIFSFPTMLIIEMAEQPNSTRLFRERIQDLRLIRMLTQMEYMDTEKQRFFAGIAPRGCEWNFEKWRNQQLEARGLYPDELGFTSK